MMHHFIQMDLMQNIHHNHFLVISQLRVISKEKNLIIKFLLIGKL